MPQPVFDFCGIGMGSRRSDSHFCYMRERFQPQNTVCVCLILFGNPNGYLTLRSRNIKGRKINGDAAMRTRTGKKPLLLPLKEEK